MYILKFKLSTNYRKINQSMIFIGILLKYLMLFNKIENSQNKKKYNVFHKKIEKRFHKEEAYGKKIIGIEKKSL